MVYSKVIIDMLLNDMQMLTDVALLYITVTGTVEQGAG